VAWGSADSRPPGGGSKKEEKGNRGDESSNYMTLMKENRKDVTKSRLELPNEESTEETEIKEDEKKKATEDTRER